ncbi:uncharacterized protein LOC123313706 [Coccinella septempunctata]|uniref:uncharacterized protein LOC123313706 n=1 Tax=Coccinella septempunctata TaxID=41139 RepID=UPI001D0696BA|nr:uncharacterized protein LOC123313706 [Coccinella septempunctata]
MSRHVVTLTKWIPLDICDKNELFIGCKELKRDASNLLYRISNFSQNIQSKSHSKMLQHLIEHDLDFQELEDICDTMDVIQGKYSNIFPQLNRGRDSFIEEKMHIWKDILWKLKLKICYNIQQVVVDTGHLFVYFGNKILELVMRLCKIYNTLLTMNQKYSMRNDISICGNTCPKLLFPLKKMSVTRLLQILAINRAEVCCHKLIDCLLETYKNFEGSLEEDDGSDNSSIEIYRALTKHMSLPEDDNNDNKHEKLVNRWSDETFLNMEKLLSYEEKNVEDLLETAACIVPSMLGSEGIRKSKNTGTSKINKKAKAKVLEYYEEILWGEVANYLEHIVLWWAPSPLALRVPHSSQHLREWILQFIPTADIPPVISSALTSLADALGVHVTSTSWDQNFRLGLVASAGKDNLETGVLMKDTLEDLVDLCNQCEATPDWIVGAPLEEIPIVEQIPVLHRLDHTVHTIRLWAINESKKYAHSWNVAAFFKIVCKDIALWLSHLDILRLQDHTLTIEKGGLGEHVRVCSLMRAKLVSEVRENIRKLRNTTAECIENLASICRIICLAILKMIFPPPSYWRNEKTLPPVTSRYVDKYLNQIMLPVLVASDDHLVTNMILKLVCESWLDHIYMTKIIFSHGGAIQLLQDFAHVKIWIDGCAIIDNKMKKRMVKNEILRRCEGVGKLLLRRPGEHIKMNDKKHEKQDRNPPESSDSEKNVMMPPEMYVPNQEQWLELRAMKKKIFLPKLCCE